MVRTMTDGEKQEDSTYPLDGQSKLSCLKLDQQERRHKKI